MARNYSLDRAVVTCGEGSIPVASVRIITPDGKEVADAAIGVGPVDAVYKAIDRVMKVPNTLISFTIKSTSIGAEAAGEVRIEIKKNNKVYAGCDNDVDIIAAAAKAYMNALNSALTDIES